MFCPNCGKQIKDNDNFCRYCGFDLRNDEINTNENEHPIYEQVIDYSKNYEKVEKEPEKEVHFEKSGEEFVLYDVKKHWMSIFWTIFLTPVFFIYFWNVFLNTHSFLSWIIALGLLAAIVYPAMRYNSDKIIITNHFAHVKIGIINPVEIDIPLDKLQKLEVSQTSFGRMLDYGLVSLISNSERYDYGYVKYPEDLQYIIDNPLEFVQESLSEDEKDFSKA